MTTEPPGGVRRLRAEPLSARRFARYGDVIETAAARDHRSINEGHTLRFHDLAALRLDTEGGRPCISLFRTRPKVRPLLLTHMERHPLSSQAFFPLSRRPYLVVVAPAGAFDAGAMEAFVAGSEQGVNYHAGTWHHYSLALEAESDFLVVDRTGGAPDLDEVALDPPVIVDLPEDAQ